MVKKFAQGHTAIGSGKVQSSCHRAGVSQTMEWTTGGARDGFLWYVN